jgi:hypothetical protein
MKVYNVLRDSCRKSTDEILKDSCGSDEGGDFLNGSEECNGVQTVKGRVTCMPAEELTNFS